MTRTETEYQALHREAVTKLQSGDLQGAVDLQTALIDELLELNPKSVSGQPALATLLERAGQELVDWLRWQKEYERAIALQQRLGAALPHLVVAFRVGSANLRLEIGQVEEALADLVVMSAEAPDDFWVQISLGTAYLFAEKYAEAEAVLTRAASMSHIRKVDRALAQGYLYGLFDAQSQSEKALAAWREGSRLDSSMRSELAPQVFRMLIRTKKFKEARKLIAMDTNAQRKAFYLGLLAFEEGNKKEAYDRWRDIVLAAPVAALRDGHDEYAEASLRVSAPAGTIQALQPLVDKGDATCFRAVLLGLAYAMQRDGERARQYFDIAMRLGEMDRPRRTVATLRGRRVFNENLSRIFNEVPLAPEIRVQTGDYFVNLHFQPSGAEKE